MQDFFIYFIFFTFFLWKYEYISFIVCDRFFIICLKEIPLCSSQMPLYYQCGN